jgi:hypothetical protein
VHAAALFWLVVSSSASPLKTRTDPTQQSLQLSINQLQSTHNPPDPTYLLVIAQHGVHNCISDAFRLRFLTIEGDLDRIPRSASKVDILSPCRRIARLRHSILFAWEVSSSHLLTPPPQWVVLRYSAEVIREKVQDGVTGETRDLQYTQCKIVGNGSFGVVFQTKLSPSGEDAAIKRVLQDKRFKVSREFMYAGIAVARLYAKHMRQNRELQIMRIVRHPNIVQLKAFYYSNGERVRIDPQFCRLQDSISDKFNRRMRFI